MSVEVKLRLTNAEALAVLNSEGLTNGHGTHRSIPLRTAEMKLIGAVQGGWNDAVEARQSKEPE